MRRPNPWAAAFIARNRLHIVPDAPDPVEPDPHIPDPLREPARVDPSVEKQVEAFKTTHPARRPCGHCMHGKDGHGRRYGALVGWHEWVSEAPSPSWMRGEDA